MTNTLRESTPTFLLWDFRRSAEDLRKYTKQNESAEVALRQSVPKQVGQSNNNY